MRVGFPVGLSSATVDLAACWGRREWGYQSLLFIGDGNDGPGDGVAAARRGHFVVDLDKTPQQMTD